MTRNDLPAATEEAGPRGFFRFGRVAIAGIAMAFATGILFGFASRVLEDGVQRPLVAVAILAATGVVLFFAARTVLREGRKLLGEPAGPRTRKARWTLVASLVIGGVLGAIMTLGDGRANIFDQGPVSPGVAIAAIAIWSVVVPLLSLFWWRNIDEHEAQSYRAGALAGMYTYAAIAPAWWIAWRAALLPRPQEMVTFLIVVAVWGLVWAWHRFR